MPMVQVDLRRELLEKAGVRHDDLLISVDDVGFEDRYAGGPIDEEVQR